MLGPTHLAAGALAAVVGLHVTGAPLEYWGSGIALGAAAGLLPDIDSPSSTASKAVPFWEDIRGGNLAYWMSGAGVIAWLGARFAPEPIAVPDTLWTFFMVPAALALLLAVALKTWMSHRGPTHSLLAIAGFALITRLVWSSIPDPLWLSLTLGYASHPAIDSFNRNGVAFLWPVEKRRWSVRKSRLLFFLWPICVKTGSPGEYVWRVALTLATIGVTVYHFADLAFG